MAVAYFVVFPLAFGFFTSTAPADVVIAPDINNDLSFVMALIMAFGISFEVPIAIILRCWSGATTVASLNQKRPYILVGAFVVGMLVTRPDGLSQTLLAIPLYLLFELGVFFARFYAPRNKTAPQDEEAEE